MRCMLPCWWNHWWPRVIYIATPGQSLIAWDSLFCLDILLAFTLSLWAPHILLPGPTGWRKLQWRYPTQERHELRCLHQGSKLELLDQCPPKRFKQSFPEIRRNERTYLENFIVEVIQTNYPLFEGAPVGIIFLLEALWLRHPSADFSVCMLKRRSRTKLRSLMWCLALCQTGLGPTWRGRQNRVEPRLEVRMLKRIKRNAKGTIVNMMPRFYAFAMGVTFSGGKCCGFNATICIAMCSPQSCLRQIMSLLLHCPILILTIRIGNVLFPPAHPPSFSL